MSAHSPETAPRTEAAFRAGPPDSRIAGQDSVAYGQAGDDLLVRDKAGAAPPGTSDAEGIAEPPLPDRDVVHALYDPVAGARGTLDHGDSAGGSDGAFRRASFETVVPCFTPGALVATIRGAVPVERLRVGDLVQTADNGLQQVIWVGLRRLGPAELAARPDLRPVRFGPGALGNPEAMLVSPQHRFLAQGSPLLRAALTGEHFVDAGLLAAMPGIDAALCKEARTVTYAHFMTERHEVVFVDGVATETLYPGVQTLGAMPAAARAEIAALFPALFRDAPDPADPARVYGPLARPELTRAALSAI